VVAAPVSPMSHVPGAAVAAAVGAQRAGVCPRIDETPPVGESATLLRVGLFAGARPRPRSLRDHSVIP